MWSDISYTTTEKRPNLCKFSLPAYKGHFLALDLLESRCILGSILGHSCWILLAYDDPDKKLGTVQNYEIFLGAHLDAFSGDIVCHHLVPFKEGKF